VAIDYSFDTAGFAALGRYRSWPLAACGQIAFRRGP
jgi:hypothetical protein